MARAARSVSARQHGRKSRGRETKKGVEPNLIQLVIKDVSMEPVFCMGERIVVQTNERPLADDYVVARLPNGEHVLRKYRPRRNGAFDLVPENPKFEAVSSNEKGPVELIAVLLEHHRKRGGSLGRRTEPRNSP